MQMSNAEFSGWVDKMRTMGRSRGISWIDPICNTNLVYIVGGVEDEIRMRYLFNR